MTGILKIPFNLSYWVVPGKLLAGCYTGSEDPIEEERNLKGLIQEGIRHVTSLMEIKDQILRHRIPLLIVLFLFL